jgi:hypothetical protein
MLMPLRWRTRGLDARVSTSVGFLPASPLLRIIVVDCHDVNGALGVARDDLVTFLENHPDAEFGRRIRSGKPHDGEVVEDASSSSQTSLGRVIRGTS